MCPHPLYTIGFASRVFIQLIRMAMTVNSMAGSLGTLQPAPRSIIQELEGQWLMAARQQVPPALAGWWPKPSVPLARFAKLGFIW